MNDFPNILLEKNNHGTRNMPKQSERQRLMIEIIDLMGVAILEEEDDEELHADERETDALQRFEEGALSSSVDDLTELLVLVESSRYQHKCHRIARSIDFIVTGFHSLSSREFRQLTRTTRECFYRVVGEIEGHDVFQNSARVEQAPVWQQLAVALDRPGNYGNEASIGRTQKLWGIGHGTCALFTTRVLKALESLSSKYVKWPDEDKRRATSRRMAQAGFWGSIGFIDVTTIPLAQKPAVGYYDRKQRYSVNAEVVCDARRKIIAFYAG